jgi:multisubunit Na+/H+ antiporter MnhE subunit
MRSAGTHRWKRPSWSVALLSLLTLAVLWVLFVGGTRVHEMLVGFVVLVLSGSFLIRVGQMDSLELDFQMRDLLTCWRIPWYLLSDGYTILAVLVKDLAGAKGAGSFYRYSGFKTSGHDPRLGARRVLATAYTSATPNSIVIGVDVSQSRMLFHQLKRSKVSLMTKALGAQPGVERS